MSDDIATADESYDTTPIAAPRVRIPRPAAQGVATSDPHAAAKPRFGLRASTTTGLRAHVGLQDTKQGA